MDKTKYGIFVNQIINEYQNGASCSSLARKYKYSISGISYILKKNNVYIVQPSDTITYDWSFIYNPKEKEFFLYWLGWMLSDGCIHHRRRNKRNRGVTTHMTTNDKYILEFFRNRIDKCRCVRSVKISNAYRLDINIPRKDAEYLEQWALIPRKSLILKPTNMLNNLNKSEFMQLFVGLIEGDGFIKTSHIKSKNHAYPIATIGICSASIFWIEWIVSKLFEYGYSKRKITIQEPNFVLGKCIEPTSMNPIYYYKISGKDAIRLYDELMETKYHLLDRKWKKLENFINEHNLKAFPVNQ